ncbi:para-nitrobenzyl esterase [Saccharothrix saharensis]|uniref:Para-nitrobenzyl esterase n=1 Tax=Saccharothrix saharensis TaxID=571190 RepID=A0A543JER2_9PSEU|nr:carboxylesterase family protein [Saccharothrix saharensis]TQM81339.1 para-nitrobenzyl esterase [Saccharothrix saharensis]
MRRGTRALITAAAAALVVTACGGGDVERADVVRVENGEVRGVVRADHAVFQGIPYAMPPKGELRWRSPHRPADWAGVRDATKPGSPCPQVGSSYSDTRSTDEDCLFLNVTTPSTEGRRPVMVWLHGDGAIGAGHHFDATALATKGDVVVVTPNYRLGVFGGFGLAGLAGSGTFALQDQREALDWVRRNIAAFGGDPGNVTLFGVSYGASATAAHLISPASRGLFHKAIMHSGFALVDLPAEAWYPGLGALPWLAWRDTAEIEQLGRMVTVELGCADIDCLRALPVGKLLEYPQVMNIFQPFGYGNPDLPKVPAEAFPAGEVARVPVLAGNTRHEHRNLVEVFRGPVAAEDYPRLLAAAFGDRAAEVEREYPQGAFESPGRAWAAVLTDRVWARATFRQHELLSAHTPTYAFEFADEEASEHGASHSTDIGYLFPDRELTDRQRDLSDAMIRYWTAFARTGDPNTGGLPHWPAFGEGRHVQSLASGAITGVDYRAEHRLDFWQG